MNRQQGFIGSFIEFMIVIAMLGIAAAIIIPIFNGENRTIECQAQVDAGEINSLEECTVEEIDFGISININSTPTEAVVTETIVTEAEEGVTNVETLCLDGIEYWVVTMNGRDLLAPHQDRYGDNERCYEN